MNFVIHSILRCAYLVIAIILYTSLTPSFAQTPDALRLAWKEHRYKDFLQLSLQSEEKNPSFKDSFNVALGLFMTAQTTKALKKVSDLEQSLQMNPQQQSKLATLKSDIHRYTQSLSENSVWQKVKVSGKVIMDTGNKKPLDPNCKIVKSNKLCSNADIQPSKINARDQRPNAGRSASKLGLTAEEGEQVLQAHNSKQLESYGYDTSPHIVTKLEPE